MFAISCRYDQNKEQVTTDIVVGSSQVTVEALVA